MNLCTSAENNGKKHHKRAKLFRNTIHFLLVFPVVQIVAKTLRIREQREDIKREQENAERLGRGEFIARYSVQN